MTILAFIKYMKWKRVSVVYTDEPYGQGLANSFINHAVKDSIKIISSHVISMSSKDVVYEDIATLLNQYDSRIVIYFGQAEQYKNQVAAARKQGIYGPGYAWIGTDALSALVSSFDEETSLFSGTLYFFPIERVGKEADEFDDYYALHYNATSYVDNALASPSKPGAYSYFEASCLDLLVLGFDRLLKNTNSTVGDLVSGKLTTLVNFPALFNFPDH